MQDKTKEMLLSLKRRIDFALSIRQISTDEIRLLERDSRLLEYLEGSNEGWEPSKVLTPSNPICAAPDCPRGWRDGVINYARAGYDPVWYCLEHGEKMRSNGTFVTGMPADPKIALAKAREMSGRWTAYLTSLEKSNV